MRGAADLGVDLGRIEGLRVEPGASLASRTTLRIGGPAELWVEVSSPPALGELRQLIQAHRLPFLLLGQGSNILIPDDGLTGVVGRLVGSFREVTIEGEAVSAGAGVALAQLARQTARQNLVGLEALAGFPSTVGGAVWMNAGCYGSEIKDVLQRVELVEADGRMRELGVDELEPGYRSTNLQAGPSIVTRAIFRLRRGDGEAALKRMTELNRRRWSSLPSGKASAGSIFRNPPGDHAGRLIEACGLKGCRRGKAAISERHANVIVNTGGAQAAEVLALMGLAFGSVYDRFGVPLEPEIVLAGSLAESWRAMVAQETG